MSTIVDNNDDYNTKSQNEIKCTKIHVQTYLGCEGRIINIESAINIVVFFLTDQVNRRQHTCRDLNASEK